MADQDSANDPSKSNRNTTEPRADAQHRDDIARLLEGQAALQRDMRNATARLNQFIDTASRQLANPLATIGGITVSLRNPTDDQSNMFGVGVYPPVDENRPNAFQQRWNTYFRNMHPAHRDQLAAFVRSRDNAVSGETPPTTGNGATSGSFQPTQGRASEPSNRAHKTQTKAVLESHLEKNSHVNELEEGGDQPRSPQGRATPQGTQELTRLLDASQQPNESGAAESSSDAQDRAARRERAPDVPSAQRTNTRTDEQIAIVMQQDEYEKIFLKKTTLSCGLKSPSLVSTT